PAVRVASVSSTARAPRKAVPILMYHGIGDVPADARLPALFVSPPRFASQVNALQRAGYHAVTMQQVWNAWHHGGGLPRRPVVLSFDDGSEGQVRHALPILRSAGWPAVLNLTWRFLPEIGGAGAVRGLVRAGWEIDSHSLNHPDLTQLPAAELRRELTGSRTRIRRTFGARHARFFAYPSGRYDAGVKRAVRAAGYLAATTVERGFAKPTSDPHALARVQVDGDMDATALLRRLRELRP
ncbi:MAG: polysaccharide deacetylase family protein, partial [Actinomycetota bacterium]|nr:polysaccharide deacetylase family protein [Actinomycetota bacterium]